MEEAGRLRWRAAEARCRGRHWPDGGEMTVGTKVGRENSPVLEKMTTSPGLGRAGPRDVRRSQVVLGEG